MMTRQLTTTQDFKQSIQNGVSLIDFNAPWCGPCRAQEPIIQQLAEQFTGQAIIAEMNVDENQETAIALGIQSIPTLALFKDGKEVKRFVGLQSSQTLTQAIEETIGKKD
jgi:thioredoxin 1